MSFDVVVCVRQLEGQQRAARDVPEAAHFRDQVATNWAELQRRCASHDGSRRILRLPSHASLVFSANQWSVVWRHRRFRRIGGNVASDRRRRWGRSLIPADPLDLILQDFCRPFADENVDGSMARSKSCADYRDYVDDYSKYLQLLVPIWVQRCLFQGPTL